MLTWMLYGAYGRTGRLIVDEALRRGHRPVLAGRDAAKLEQLKQVTGLWRRRTSLSNMLRACAPHCRGCDVWSSPRVHSR